MLDARSYQIGFRTLELRREPDQWGESFTFVVNGVPIFAKGSNWIPADSFPARVTPAQLDALLGAAAATNHNMIRVWAAATTKPRPSTTCATDTGSWSGRTSCSPAASTR